MIVPPLELADTWVMTCVRQSVSRGVSEGEKTMLVTRVRVAYPKPHTGHVEVLLEQHYSCCPTGTCLDPTQAAYASAEESWKRGTALGAVENIVSMLKMRAFDQALGELDGDYRALKHSGITARGVLKERAELLSRDQIEFPF